jgi:4-amino-4-deoxy-L-arabinose transferase-like glycosyltransferase
MTPSPPVDKESGSGPQSPSFQRQEITSFWRHPLAFTVLLFAGAFVLRAALIPDDAVIDVDGAYYASLAQAFARGDWVAALSTKWPLLYPFLTAVAARILPLSQALAEPSRFELAARLVSAIAGTLILIPFYLLVRRLLPAFWAGVALLLVAVHPRLVHYSTTALTEMTYTLLLVSGLATLAFCYPKLDGSQTDRPERGTRVAPSTKASIVAGVFFGLAFLVRSEGLVLGLFLWLAVVIHSYRSGFRRRLYVGLALSLIVIAAPYLLFLRGELGTWSLGENGPYMVHLTYGAAYNEVFSEPTRLLTRINLSPELARQIEPQSLDLVGFATQRWQLIISSSLQRLINILISTLPVTVYHPFALLAILGLWRSRAGPWWLVGLPIGFIVLLYAPLSVDRRYFVPLIPLILLFAVHGLRNLQYWLGRAMRNEVRAASVVRVLIVGLAVYGVSYSISRGLNASYPVEQRQAGEWLAENWMPPDEERDRTERLRHGPIVMAYKPWVAYYSGGLIVPLRPAWSERPLSAARDMAADVLVADETSAEAQLPQMTPLLDPARAPAGLTPLHLVENPKRVVLYAIDRTTDEAEALRP